MATQKVTREVEVCDFPSAHHGGDVGAVEVTFRPSGAVWMLDVCAAHEGRVSLSDVRTYGRRVRQRKPSTRPTGADGMPDMFEPDR